jgi:hypothetical protein
MGINKNIIKKSQSEDAFGNKVLYEMCKNKPLHDNNDIISGKVKYQGFPLVWRERVFP